MQVEILHGSTPVALYDRPDGCCGALITDPPYGMSSRPGQGWKFSSHVTLHEEWDSIVDYGSFTYHWLETATRLVVPNGNLLIFSSYHSLAGVLASLAGLERKLQQLVVWRKTNPQPSINCRSLTECVEYIVWAVNATPKEATGWCFDYKLAKELNGGKQMRNVWDFPVTPRSERLGHPTQKPLALVERLVRLFTREGDVVLDPFLGSGTTAVAALGWGRGCLGVEKEAAYVEMSRRRLQDLCAAAGYGEETCQVTV